MPPGEEPDPDEGEDEGPTAGSVESRRLVHYTLSEGLDALSAVAADEVHEARAGGEAAVQARAWARLRLAASDSAPAPAAPADLPAALAALPPPVAAARLPLQPAPAPQVTDTHPAP